MFRPMHLAGLIAVVLLLGGLVAGCQMQAGQPSGAQRPSIENRDGGEGMGAGGGM